MVVDNDQYPSYSSDSEEEKDYFRIRKTDSLIFAATEEEDLSNMEVYIYNYQTQDLYVYYEIILSALQLC